MSKSAIRALILLLAATVIPACGSGGGVGGAPSGQSIPDFVVSGPGGLTLASRGGASTNGDGAAGGTVTITGKSGSDVNVLSGALSVDVSSTIPAFPSVFGSNVRTISADIAITPPASSPFTIPGDNASAPATGLHILPGITLTINPNGGAGILANLSFTSSVLNEGTIQMAQVAASNDAVGLEMICGSLKMAAGSFFLASGAAGTGALPDGGFGGPLTVQDTAGNILNLGTITTTGGSTTQATGVGGPGGNVVLTTNSVLYQSGTISAGGGNATGAALSGGPGGIVRVQGIVMGTHCGATSVITTIGGNGPTGGNDGGPVMFGLSVSSMLIAGSIDASGGSATTLGDGGSGGPIQIGFPTATYNVRVNATLTSTGGVGAGATGNGGAGGALTVTSSNLLGGSIVNPSQIVTGGLAFSGQVTLNGGTGATGGAGGAFSVSLDLDNSPPGLNPVNVVGYQLIDTSGGTGTTGGGTGGGVTISNVTHTAEDSTTLTLGGVLNSVPIVTKGGTPSAGPGGFGGPITFKTDQSVKKADANGRSVQNLAALNVSGGDGTTVGGDGAIVILLDAITVVNSGNVLAHGGSGATGGQAGQLKLQQDPFGYLPSSSVSNSGTLAANGGTATGSGGTGGVLQLTGHGRATNTGAVTAQGGAGGTGSGGDAGQVALTADAVVVSSAAYTLPGGGSVAGSGGRGGVVLVTAPFASHSGNITSTGGNAATGGNGGILLLDGSKAPSTAHGTFNMAAGTGGTTPRDGEVFVDGIQLVLTAGVGTF